MQSLPYTVVIYHYSKRTVFTHLCCVFSFSGYRWAAWCHFSASQVIWFKAPHLEPASLTWRGVGRSPSAYVRGNFPVNSLSPKLSVCRTNAYALSTPQPTPVSSQRARSMWTWWGWTCLVLATPWCTAVSMATSWQGAQSTESVKVMARGLERCPYVEVNESLHNFSTSSKSSCVYVVCVPTITVGWFHLVYVID